jgi:transcriptional regulator with XRE-family HTH domain
LIKGDDVLDNQYIFDKKVFAERIKQARKKRNLTQEALSSLLNINVNTLAKCESSRNKLTLSYTNLIELVNILDIDVNYIFMSEQAEEKRKRTTQELTDLIEGLTDKEKNVVLTLIRSLIENRETS